MNRSLFYFIPIIIGVVLMQERGFASGHSVSHGRQEIKVPLGFAWNDSPQKLEVTARSGGLTIVNQEVFPSSGKLVTTVHGVVGNALEKNIFTFIM